MESINREVLDKREVIKSIFKKTDEKKQQLLPDPILNLKYILGFSGKTCNLIRFNITKLVSVIVVILPCIQVKCNRLVQKWLLQYLKN